MLNYFIASLLLAGAIGLFVATLKGWIDDKNLNRLDQIGGVLAFIIALLLLIWQPFDSLRNNTPIQTTTQGDSLELTPPITTANLTRINPAEDINQGCISVDNWIPFASVSQTFNEKIELTAIPQPYCWYLFDWGIRLEDGKLLFMAEEIVTDKTSYVAGIFGILSPISLEDTLIGFNLTLTPLDTADKFFVGIVPSESRNPNTNGVLLTFSQTLTDEYYIDLSKWNGVSSDTVGIDSKIGGLYRPVNHDIRIDINSGLVTVYVDGEVFGIKPIGVVVEKPALWIGYEKSILSDRTRIEVSGLTIQQNAE